MNVEVRVIPTPHFMHISRNMFGLKKRFNLKQSLEQESAGSIFLPSSQRIDIFGNICNTFMIKLE